MQEKPPWNQKLLRKNWNSSTCGRASGLDSKMTIRTPIGTVFWTTSRLLEILVLLFLHCVRKEMGKVANLTTLPTLVKLLSAIWLSPLARSSSFALVRTRRSYMGPVRPRACAAARSFSLAARISRSLVIRLPARCLPMVLFDLLCG